MKCAKITSRNQTGFSFLSKSGLKLPIFSTFDIIFAYNYVFFFKASATKPNQIHVVQTPDNSLQSRTRLSKIATRWPQTKLLCLVVLNLSGDFWSVDKNKLIIVCKPWNLAPHSVDVLPLERTTRQHECFSAGKRDEKMKNWFWHEKNIASACSYSSNDINLREVFVMQQISHEQKSKRRPHYPGQQNASIYYISMNKCIWTGNVKKVQIHWSNWSAFHHSLILLNFDYYCQRLWQVITI